MKVGIICASERELAPFLPELCGCITAEKAMLKFHKGKLYGAGAVALFCGVCKVNAAIGAQLLISEYGADIIINAGVAGALSDSLKLLDTIISTDICYHDVAPGILTEYHPWMKSEFFKADPRLIELSKAAVQNLGMQDTVKWGRMATGEAFIAGAERKRIIDKFAPLTVDMETASIAHVCYANGIPFIAIRSVTDTAANDAERSFEANLTQAAWESKCITVELVRIAASGL